MAATIWETSSLQWEDQEAESAPSLQLLPEPAEHIPPQSLNILPRLQLQEHGEQVGIRKGLWLAQIWVSYPNLETESRVLRG